mmetsp:Transcript_3568/g.6240  ORF Transcript_3568/g.6240 Transcript_3568/m.6240 type:complete len:175 (-) Transcript_3568:125-649(-)
MVNAWFLKAMEGLHEQEVIAVLDKISHGGLRVEWNSNENRVHFYYTRMDSHCSSIPILNPSTLPSVLQSTYGTMVHEEHQNVKTRSNQKDSTAWLPQHYCPEVNSNQSSNPNSDSFQYSSHSGVSGSMESNSISRRTFKTDRVSNDLHSEYPKHSIRRMNCSQKHNSAVYLPRN